MGWIGMRRTLALVAAVSVLAAGRRAAAADADVPPPPGARISLGAMTACLIAGQFALVGAFTGQWGEDGHSFSDGFSKGPVWDDDTYEYDYVLHPIAGSEYYLTARNRGLTRAASFGYSAMLSAFYEYVPENIIQQPSATDLIVTPLGGFLLGEARYNLKQRIAARKPTSFAGRVAYVLLDPLDVTVGGYPDGRPKLFFGWSTRFF